MPSYNGGMRALPGHTPSRRHFGALFISLALVGAACGGGGESTTTEPVATDPSTSVVATTEPAPTTSLPAPPAPTPTVPKDSDGFPGDGDWTAYYRVTSDNGWFGTTAVAYSFPVTFDCDDAECSSGLSRPNPTGDRAPALFNFDGDILSTQYDGEVACLDPTTGEATGPRLTNTSLIDTLTPVLEGTNIIAFVGVRDFAGVTEGSEKCTEEDASYTADVVYLSDDANTPATITADGWFRTGYDEDVFERAIRLCTATPCDLQYRIPRSGLVADGSYQSVFIDVPLTQNADGTYTGSTTFIDSCASDIDQSFVAAEGYDATLEVTLTAVQVGDQMIIRATEVQTGTTHASLTAEQAAVCTDYEFETSVNGIRMVDGAVDVISWADPPINE